jgi:hypothetical protein
MERIISNLPTITAALKNAGCKQPYLAMLANIANARLHSGCSVESTIAIWRKRCPEYFE